MPERWKVLTYRDYDFEDDGKRVRGRSLYCYRANSENGWPGVEYHKFSISFGSEAYNTKVRPGAEYDLFFNRFGKVASLVAVDA